MRRTTLHLVVLAGFLLAACGENGDDAVSTMGSNSTSAPATTLIAPPPSATPGPGASPTSTLPPTTGPVGPALSAASTLDLRGLGPVRVGMTLAEASTAAGIPVVAPSATAECTYATATGGPAGVRFMLIDRRIARVDVITGSAVKTRSGAGVGDTEAQVQARYSNGLQVSKHKYDPNGRYLTLVPNDAADTDLRLIFETDGSKVTNFRSGKVPEVEFVEGCS